MSAVTLFLCRHRNTDPCSGIGTPWVMVFANMRGTTVSAPGPISTLPGARQLLTELGGLTWVVVNREHEESGHTALRHRKNHRAPKSAAIDAPGRERVVGEQLLARFSVLVWVISQTTSTPEPRKRRGCVPRPRHESSTARQVVPLRQ